MSAVYGNWERLVGATLRREQLRRIAQRSFSDLSLESSPSFNSSASSRRLCSSDFPNLLVGEGFDHDQILGGANYLKIFTFAELKSATRNFKPDRVLDGGGFGWVFKGWIDENTYAPSRLGVGIAVTVKLFDPESKQDLKAWQMSAVYDNWDRLVGATLRREQLRRRALRSFSDLSLASSSSFNFNLSEGEANEEISLAPNYLKIFSFAELKSATRDFGRLSKLDGGVFEPVYKGWIDENTYAPSKPGVGIAVTVKWFYAESGLDFNARQAKIEFLGKSSHPNIVKLLGYCLEDNRFLLVSEDMQQESLEHHLFSSADTLSWEIRMKIAIGAARALAFLHTMEVEVIHRDINAAKIWLDGDYNAKLSNISFVILEDILDEFYSSYEEKHPNFIRLRILSELGGYVAREDANIATMPWTPDLYMKTEVYRFGVVLLQIVSGRPAFNPNRFIGEKNLVNWARSLLPHKSMSREIMDPRLEGQYPSRAVLQVAKLINECLQPYPKIPPPMKQVLETLERIGALKMNPNDSKADHKPEKPANHRHLKFQLPPLRPKAWFG